MKQTNTKKVLGFFAQTLAAMSLAAAVNATPIDATVEVESSGYSVIHMGATPGGAPGTSADWLWFDDNQSLFLDLTGGIVSLIGTQSFTLESQNSQTATLEITALDLDLNDVTDGFSSGTLDYSLDGTSGTFTFLNENYNSIFNSSSFDGTNLEFFIWGGDEENGIGIDLGVTGVIAPPSQVPVPSSLMLSVLAMGALVRSRRKKTTV